VREDRVHAVLEASTAMRPIDRAHAREVTGLAGGPALLWVGRLNHNKDPLTVVNGFARALDALPSAATLSLVFGDGTLLPEVRRRIDADARLAGRVRLVGERPRDELAAWYSAADLFVLGSHHEALGYAALEACACGLTPLITDIAPFRAITGDGAIGLLWTPGDAGACARAIVTASRRDLEQERSAVAAHFDAHLSWRATGARALGIYERVAREARARLRRPIAAW
jgi:glycosyltransferase involved in cell wall biosynthesis